MKIQEIGEILSGKKYRVEQNGQFLGHWCAHSAAEAVEKAVNGYGKYYEINANDWFDVYRNGDVARIYVGEE